MVEPRPDKTQKLQFKPFIVYLIIQFKAQIKLKENDDGGGCGCGGRMKNVQINSIETLLP